MAACSARTVRSPVSIAHRRAPARCASGSESMRATRAALSFSQIRGTAPQTVGRTSGSAAATARGSATQVTVKPKAIPW